jgi:RNA polymerase sigma-70 factor (ECF subfamily)
MHLRKFDETLDRQEKSQKRLICIFRHYNQPHFIQRLTRVPTSRPPAAAQFDALYGTLHRIAAAQMRRERSDHTLSATALMHEAYLSLARSREVPLEPAQFSALASHVMRNVLVNHAVARSAEKRGGGVPALSLTQAVSMEGGSHNPHDAEVVDIQALHEALQALERRSERQARIVELRYFAGLSLEDIAVELKISLATVKRDWTVVRLFLRRALASEAT